MLSQGVFIPGTIAMSDWVLVGITLGKHTFHLHDQLAWSGAVSQESSHDSK